MSTVTVKSYDWQRLTHCCLSRRVKTAGACGGCLDLKSAASALPAAAAAYSALRSGGTLNEALCTAPRFGCALQTLRLSPSRQGALFPSAAPKPGSPVFCDDDDRCIENPNKPNQVIRSHCRNEHEGRIPRNHRPARKDEESPGTGPMIEGKSDSEKGSWLFKPRVFFQFEFFSLGL
jgi:hypothetical protein